MQSTGQAGTQSSQPVQSSSITVCMRLAAPTIASTGQALRQSAQPMHAASSMTREPARTFGAAVRVERHDGPAGQPRQPRDALGAAGRAAVDLGLAAGDRLGVAAAVGVAAARALRLRQGVEQRLDERAGCHRCSPQALIVRRLPRAAVALPDAAWCAAMKSRTSG